MTDTDTAGRERRAAAMSNDELIEQYSVAMTRQPWNHSPHRKERHELRNELRRRLNATDAASAAAGSNVPGEELTVEWAQEIVCVPVESIENVIDIAEFGRKRLDAGHYGAIIAACQAMLAAESAEASGDREGGM